MKITTEILKQIIKEEIHTLRTEEQDAEENLSDAEEQEYLNKIVNLILDNADNPEFIVQGLEIAGSVGIEMTLTRLAEEFNERMNADKSGETEMNFGLKQVESSGTYKRVWAISRQIMQNTAFGDNDKFAYLKVLGWQYAEELVCLIPNMCDE